MFCDPLFAVAQKPFRRWSRVVRSSVTATILVIAFLVSAQAQDVKLPRVFLLDAKVLQQERQKGLSNPGAQSELVKAAEAEANKTMNAGPFSVVQKDSVPPSGDKHDYMSLAPYFWPNPDTPNHLPYVRRDGERNPEIKAISDHDNMGRMCSVVRALALGYYLTGNENYSARAALLLRTWFLDPATKMNPNLEFAQAIRGVNTGRGIGIIESQGLTNVVDAAGVLQGSRNWSGADDAALRSWFKGFLTWLRTSNHGKDESNSKNNHGSFYDVQVVDFALYVSEPDIAHEVASKAGQKRIAVQITPDGKQPLELARTKSFSYSVFNLRALTELATLSDEVGVDLWHFETRDGRSIRKALVFLLPYALGEKSWPYKQIEDIKSEELVSPLLEAARAYKHPEYEAEAKRLEANRPNVNLMLLESAVKGD